MSTRAPILPVLLLLAGLAGLAFGQVWVGPDVLWHGAVTGEGAGAMMLSTFRGPRVAVALGAGAALGLSGALFQTLFRNPLASPDVIGFTSGAALAVVGLAAGAVVVRRAIVPERTGAGTPAASSTEPQPTRWAWPAARTCWPPAACGATASWWTGPARTT